MEELYHKIYRRGSLSTLPLGHYTVGETKTFCFLKFNDSILPDDLPGKFILHLQDITFLTCVPRQERPFLESIYQIGQLYVSLTNKAKTAVPSSFVVAVTPQREVFWIWNPHGLEPDDYLDGEDISPKAYLTRPTRGRLRGFETPCTAVRLIEDLDQLCNNWRLDKHFEHLGCSLSGFHQVSHCGLPAYQSTSELHLRPFPSLGRRKRKYDDDLAVKFLS